MKNGHKKFKITLVSMKDNKPKTYRLLNLETFEITEISRPKLLSSSIEFINSIENVTVVGDAIQFTNPADIVYYTVGERTKFGAWAVQHDRYDILRNIENVKDLDMLLVSHKRVSYRTEDLGTIQIEPSVCIAYDGLLKGKMTLLKYIMLLGQDEVYKMLERGGSLEVARTATIHSREVVLLGDNSIKTELPIYTLTRALRFAQSQNRLYETLPELLLVCEMKRKPQVSKKATPKIETQASVEPQTPRTTRAQRAQRVEQVEKPKASAKLETLNKDFGIHLGNTQLFRVYLVMLINAYYAFKGEELNLMAGGLKRKERLLCHDSSKRVYVKLLGIRSYRRINPTDPTDDGDCTVIRIRAFIRVDNFVDDSLDMINNLEAYEEQPESSEIVKFIKSQDNKQLLRIFTSIVRDKADEINKLEMSDYADRVYQCLKDSESFNRFINYGAIAPKKALTAEELKAKYEARMKALAELNKTGVVKKQTSIVVRKRFAKSWTPSDKRYRLMKTQRNFEPIQPTLLGYNKLPRFVYTQGKKYKFVSFMSLFDIVVSYINMVDSERMDCLLKDGMILMNDAPLFSLSPEELKNPRLVPRRKNPNTGELAGEKFYMEKLAKDGDYLRLLMTVLQALRLPTNIAYLEL